MRLRIRGHLREKGISNLIDVKSRMMKILIPKNVIKFINTPITSEARQPVQIVAKSKGRLRVRERKCIICLKQIQLTDELVQCPHCEMTFHQNHWEAWIRHRHRCPYCRQNV